MREIRKIGVLGLLLLSAAGGARVAAAEPVTAETIVARCAEALGGAGKIAAVTTLRFTVAYPGNKTPHITEIKRPGRIRTEAGYILVFNGRRAGFLKGAPAQDGKDPGPQLVEAESWRDFEADIAFLFPAFFDHKAEYLGLEAVGGREFHRLGVALPLGLRMNYFIDAATFLPQRIVADVPYRGEVFHPERVVGDYEETRGVLFPRSFTSTGWGEKGRASVTSVEINVPLADDRFEMPEGPSHPTTR